jgi:hypothetical protein
VVCARMGTGGQAAMNEHGAEVRRLMYLEAIGGPSTRISEQPDGSWAAIPARGPESEAEIARGRTPEEAAAARIRWLEAHAVYVPEPPIDYQRPRNFGG